MDFDETLKIIIIIIFCYIPIIIVVGMFIYYDIEKTELIIKNSENYNIYDNCTKIDNKYYCEVIENV